MVEGAGCALLSPTPQSQGKESGAPCLVGTSSPGVYAVIPLPIISGTITRSRQLGTATVPPELECL